jgi:hypothetical protein
MNSAVRITVLAGVVHLAPGIYLTGERARSLQVQLTTDTCHSSSS